MCNSSMILIGEKAQTFVNNLNHSHIWCLQLNLFVSVITANNPYFPCSLVQTAVREKLSDPVHLYLTGHNTWSLVSLWSCP